MVKNQIIEALKGMTILEIELVQACEEGVQVSAAAAVNCSTCCRQRRSC